MTAPRVDVASGPQLRTAAALQVNGIYGTRPLVETGGDVTKERWDAGDMGCGQLVFELRLRMNKLKRGDRLELVARDPGAPTDLPAWCRMTGHTLVSADHPVYVIQRNTD